MIIPNKIPVEYFITKDRENPTLEVMAYPLRVVLTIKHSRMQDYHA